MTFIQAIGALVTLGFLIFTVSGVVSGLLVAAWQTSATSTVMTGKRAIKAAMTPLQPILQHMMVFRMISVLTLVVFSTCLFSEMTFHFSVGLSVIGAVSGHIVRFLSASIVKTSSHYLGAFALKRTLDSSKL